MTKEKLQEKLRLYEASKAELIANTFSTEIEADVEEYRKTVVAKYEAQKSADIEKHDHYIALLKDLIEEAELEEETLADDAEVNSVV